MALYITFEDNSGTNWHIGEKNPVEYGKVNFVREVQADGHELDHIHGNFSRIPEANKRVVRWFGDHAKFIVANL